jgi:CelD/BcsL family acetyltransferase involved in cellulose biosynthesis
LLAAGQENEALGALLGAARRRVALVALEALPAELAERVARVSRERFGVAPVVWSRADRALLCRRGDPADYVLLRGKRRKELRRQRTVLARELGAEPSTSDRAGEAAAVERFLALEDAGWKGRAGTSLISAGADGFFRQVCANFAATGRLQLLALDAGGRTVAMKCNLVAGDGLFCFKIAHDPALARSSPGVQLELDNLQHFQDHAELAWMDSCADPANQMINRIWPDRRRLCTLLVPGGGLIGRAGRAEAAIAATIRRRLKEHRP